MWWGKAETWQKDIYHMENDVLTGMYLNMLRRCIDRWWNGRMLSIYLGKYPYLKCGVCNAGYFGHLSMNTILFQWHRLLLWKIWAMVLSLFPVLFLELSHEVLVVPLLFTQLYGRVDPPPPMTSSSIACCSCCQVCPIWPAGSTFSGSADVAPAGIYGYLHEFLGEHCPCWVFNE